MAKTVLPVVPRSQASHLQVAERENNMEDSKLLGAGEGGKQKETNVLLELNACTAPFAFITSQFHD